MGAMSNCAEAIYVEWEEVVASSQRGRREFHYFLKRRGGGGRDLVVVGKEKNVGDDMMFDYEIQETPSLFPVLKRFGGLKLMARREVIDWLNSLVSEGQLSAPSRLSCVAKLSKVKTGAIKEAQIPCLNHHIPGFAWLGSSRACRKRKHYESFCRNGAVIHIQNFIYVLSEENKRLVAYLEDMYEDDQGNKLVLVRWFHKIDEVGFDLPIINYNDREVFFTLCLQEISVECVDGLATVLSPVHYEKLNKEASKLGIFPFVCCRQIDNHDLKQFEVTSMEGYWKQKILSRKGYSVDAVGSRSNKRARRSYDCMCSEFLQNKRSSHTSISAPGDSRLVRKGGLINHAKDGNARPPIPDGRNSTVQKLPLSFTIGSCIEVLCQDSGISGCWYRASIIKKHKDRIKVKYQDIKDAADDSKNLEEWINPSRLAAQDALGIRLFGRLITRPEQLVGRTACHSVNLGCVVDAWWHDGWWEGIVVKNESPDKINVYFPGETREAVFSLKELRSSKEWFKNCWQDMHDRPEIAMKYSNRDTSSDKADKFTTQKLIPASTSVPITLPKVDAPRDLVKDSSVLPSWVSLGKKRYKRGSHFVKTHSCSMNGNERQLSLDKLFSNSSLNFDAENCKYATVRSEHVSTLTNALYV